MSAQVQTQTIAEQKTEAPVKPVAKKAKKPGSIYLYFLLASILTVAIAGGYESVAQHYYPQQSILSYLHRSGMFTSLPVAHKPSKGIWLLMGWAGAIMMLTLMIYSLRKRNHRLSRAGQLRSWLLGHIFLGITGPLLITLHTTFKLGGLVATSFWAMVVTVSFGILGRYIYVQIPRSLSGAELKSGDIDSLIGSLDKDLGELAPGTSVKAIFDEISHVGDEKKQAAMGPLRALFYSIRNDIANMYRVYKLKGRLRSEFDLSSSARKDIGSVLRKKAALIRKKNLLKTSHALLNYWHVVHLPLAGLMFLIMFIHIAAYYVFRPIG